MKTAENVRTVISEAPASVEGIKVNRAQANLDGVANLLLPL